MGQEDGEFDDRGFQVSVGQEDVQNLMAVGFQVVCRSGGWRIDDGRGFQVSVGQVDGEFNGRGFQVSEGKEDREIDSRGFQVSVGQEDG